MLLGRIYKAGKAPVWADFQLSPSQAQLLWLVQPERPVAMNELANGLYCDASNVTGLVDKLEARQLIERRADPNDRRVKMIAVTPEGAEFRAKVVERAAEPPPSFAALSAREQRQLRDLLRKLANGMPEKP
jgi:DNA-binding MarR family transcriptional regulator